MIELVALLGGMLPASPSGPDAAPVVLHGVRHRIQEDTVRIDFVFAGARPRRERIGRAPGPDGPRELWIDFEGARLDSAAVDGLPRWLRPRSRRATDTIALRVPLDDETPWKAGWGGDTLHLYLLDRVRTRPAWANPWLLGGAGVAVVGGGVALWALLGSDAGGGEATPVDDVIPAPDIAMPR